MAVESFAITSSTSRRPWSRANPTAASALLDQGESIKAVAEWLGHTDPAFTLTTYTHLMPNSDERTKSAIAGIYGRRDTERGADGPATAQQGPTGT